MKANIFLTLFVFVLSAYTASAQATPDLILEKGVEPHQGIDEVYRRFSEGYQKLDPAMVANLYSETAAYLPPGSEIQTGRPRILESFQSFFDSVKRQNGKLVIRFRIVQRQADQNLAYDVGIYTLTSTNEKGESRQGRGKFVVVARREKDNVWRFQVDGYSDLPQAQNK